MDVDTGLLLQMHRKKKYGEVMIAKKVLNLKLRPKQEEIIREFFAKGKEGKPKYEEFLLVCGKKGGKTFLTATINLIIIYKLIIGEDFFKRFNIIPQDVYLLNTCAGKEQSIKVYLNQVKGVLSLSPFLQQFLDRNPTVDEVKFKIPKYDNNLILNNDLGGNFNSIYMDSSHNNTIMNNSIKDSWLNGIRIDISSTYNKIIKNSIIDTPAMGAPQYGIFLQTGVSNNLIKGNVISDNSIQGLVLNDGCNNNTTMENINILMDEKTEEFKKNYGIEEYDNIERMILD
ncbi:hypothetical protein LCGC14_2611200 [marine sediment metagenome]|uniref:Right handed beta helix domain-containing protein n=1 Tax=marine sediment metagenome TaxID=412755 RepID=A0A0F9CYI1_9ZZZZ